MYKYGWWRLAWWSNLSASPSSGRSHWSNIPLSKLHDDDNVVFEKHRQGKKVVAVVGKTVVVVKLKLKLVVVFITGRRSDKHWSRNVWQRHLNSHGTLNCSLQFINYHIFYQTVCNLEISFYILTSLFFTSSLSKGMSVYVMPRY